MCRKWCAEHLLFCYACEGPRNRGKQEERIHDTNRNSCRRSDSQGGCRCCQGRVLETGGRNSREGRPPGTPSDSGPAAPGPLRLLREPAESCLKHPVGWNYGNPRLPKEAVTGRAVHRPPACAWGRDRRIGICCRGAGCWACA